MSNFKAEHGLLVAWGGLNGPVEGESRHSFFSLRVWNSAELFKAIYRTYPALDGDIKAEFPLKQVWTLVPGAPE